MKKIGLTGGIGSGKSTVAQLFAFLGVPIYDSDVRAKAVTQQPAVQQQIIDQIGDFCYYPNGLYNTAKVAEKVFSSPTLLQTLTGIIYPALAEDFQAFIARHQKADYIIKEAAVLLESGRFKELDAIILLQSPLEERLTRLKTRGLTLTQITQRMQYQWSDEQRLPYANWIIYNSKNDLLMPQILQIDRLIK